MHFSWQEIIKRTKNPENGTIVRDPRTDEASGIKCLPQGHGHDYEGKVLTSEPTL